MFLLDSKNCNKEEKNISVDLDKSIDPDSLRLEIIYEKFENLLKNLPEKEKTQNNFLIKNLDFDQKIDYIKKFIKSHQDNFLRKENIDENFNVGKLSKKGKKMKLGDLLVFMANDNSLSEIKKNDNFSDFNMRKTPYKKIKILDKTKNYQNPPPKLKKSNFYLRKKKTEKKKFNEENLNISKEKIKGNLDERILFLEKEINNIFEKLMKLKNNNKKVIKNFINLENIFKSKIKKLKSNFKNQDIFLEGKIKENYNFSIFNNLKKFPKLKISNTFLSLLNKKKKKIEKSFLKKTSLKNKKDIQEKKNQKNYITKKKHKNFQTKELKSSTSLKILKGKFEKINDLKKNQNTKIIKTKKIGNYYNNYFFPKFKNERIKHSSRDKNKPKKIYHNKSNNISKNISKKQINYYKVKNPRTNQNKLQIKNYHYHLTPKNLNQLNTNQVNLDQLDLYHVKSNKKLKNLNFFNKNDTRLKKSKSENMIGFNIIRRSSLQYNFKNQESKISLINNNKEKGNFSAYKFLERRENK